MDAIHHAVLTAVGEDRPGLVDEVTRYITERGGNLEDSRMVNLRGQFAMMMLVAGSEEAMSRLQDGLGALRRGSHVHAELRPADAGAAQRPPALPFRLNTWAMDHPGLMQSVVAPARRDGRQHRERRFVAAAGAVHQHAAVRDGARASRCRRPPPSPSCARRSASSATR